ncbi:enoyl-CoA hydratase/isomerase family protein [Thalassotalea euphylliae]|uniref:3-hydroxyisobutyryl-CoA hydrolase n=1 Tax=Thalassotalea euphylliae TaxID=1655234 RepID=A0A3E0U7G8_9GAMM|nr:enoyl-CoA hydratase/isomerase family protein [Thalassotalea euphylliae]REL32493.1 enoyl-CoA hydratase/isomerase family protein [Thalassotalea euphylliae]
MSDVVLFETLNCVNGKAIGVATLNAEKSLNALSGEMIAALYPQLLAWQQDNTIAAVLLQGNGEKAFCAGGDIVKLYREMCNHPDAYAPEVEAYFANEYRLDHLIHTFGKPFMVWGNGIVMGGGLGMMVGGSHRIVTETSRIAMPEISIGLLPDVGGTKFLNEMPDNCGLFLGLTGASINAADAKYTHLADFFMLAAQKSALLDKLMTTHWSDTAADNHKLLSSLISEFEQAAQPSLPVSPVQEHKALINQVTSANTLSEIVNDIVNYPIEDKWFNRAQAALKHGSAISAHLVYRQLREGKGMSLADCYRFELGLTVKGGKYGEFQEGVRALLVDKDNQPNWQFDSIASVDNDVIDWFFSPPWSASEHPLLDLGKSEQNL